MRNRRADRLSAGTLSAIGRAPGLVKDHVGLTLSDIMREQRNTGHDQMCRQTPIFL
jgi:hypothetical protein